MAAMIPERTEDLGCPLCSYCIEARFCSVAQTHSSPPASVSQLLMLQTCTTMPGWSVFLLMALENPEVSMSC